MLLALDTYYYDTHAQTASVIFNQQDEVIVDEVIDRYTNVAPYEPGSFYKRELPCIIQLLQKIDVTTITTIIVDGHIFVDQDTFGLGGILWEHLDKKIPVIGVAKNPFYKNKETCKEVYRGVSKKPLYVSAIGVEIDTAVAFVKSLEGTHRIPTVLKRVDELSRSIGD